MKAFGLVVLGFTASVIATLLLTHTLYTIGYTSGLFLVGLAAFPLIFLTMMRFVVLRRRLSLKELVAIIVLGTPLYVLSLVPVAAFSLN